MHDGPFVFLLAIVPLGSWSIITRLTDQPEIATTYQAQMRAPRPQSFIGHSWQSPGILRCLVSKFLGTRVTKVVSAQYLQQNQSCPIFFRSSGDLPGRPYCSRNKRSKHNILLRIDMHHIKNSQNPWPLKSHFLNGWSWHVMTHSLVRY